jgi:hypothetical protein
LSQVEVKHMNIVSLAGGIAMSIRAFQALQVMFVL